MQERDMTRMTPVPLAHFERLRPYLEQALEASGAKRDWGIEDVFASAQRLEIDLWALEDEDGLFGAGATTIENYPRSKVLSVLLLGTEPNRGFMDCLEQLKALARSIGASRIEGTGRPGWARKLGAKERRVFQIEV